nr:hypothetical protein [uncultured Campylobacter sp.]
MKDYEKEVSLEELSYELDVMLEAMLLNAGVKRNKLEEAYELYVENIDDVLASLDKSVDGVDEILAVVEYLRKNHADLFGK